MRTSERRILLFTAIAVASSTNCSDLQGTDQRLVSTARVTVAGTAPVPLRLITSTDFTVARDPDGNVIVSYNRADSATITLPYDRDYSFGQARTDRFAVKIASTDTASTATFELRVFLDGEQDLRQGMTMKNSSYEYVFYRSIAP
jgi:hypothetical protein